MADHSDFELFTSLRYDPSLVQVRARGLSHAGWNWLNYSPLYMLDYHRDRMLQAATHWGWDAAVEVLSGATGLERLEKSVMASLGETQSRSPMKVRVSVTKDGKLSITSAPVPEKSLANLFPRAFPPPETGQNGDPAQDIHTLSRAPEYEVLVDHLGSDRSEHTHFKTTKRVVYDGARQRAKIDLQDLKEVLIVNKANGTIMEGSTSTPYFWRDGRWVTPPVSKEFNLKEGSGGQNGTSRRWALERGLAVEESIPVASLVDGEGCWLSTGVRGFFFGRVRLT
ncbi:hypothetical protein VTK26DRAFT_5846 [Humicola hyalothermophila]